MLAPMDEAQVALTVLILSVLRRLLFDRPAALHVARGDARQAALRYHALHVDRCGQHDGSSARGPGTQLDERCGDSDGNRHGCHLERHGGHGQRSGRKYRRVDDALDVAYAAYYLNTFESRDVLFFTRRPVAMRLGTAQANARDQSR
jgi:hypothetical protein